MSYEITASRKRPKSFDSLAGQEFVVSTMKNSLQSGRIAHAYLFSGPRGVGKTSAARILAKALNCQMGPTPNPCGVCNSCLEIQQGNHLDVIEIDGASNTSVNDIRQIKDEVLFAPNSGKYKIYIIDEVHMLSNSAFNALLKTIEEPPPYIVFIFATTEIHKVPATIKSRCQQFNFRLIPVEVIKNLLASICSESSIEAEPDALFWIAKEATGSLRDAYTLLDQVISFCDGIITYDKIKTKLGLVGFDTINGLVEKMALGDKKGALELLDQILLQGIAVEQIILDLTEYFRSLLMIQCDISREALIGCSPKGFSSLVINNFSIFQIETAIEFLLRLYREIRFSLNQRFELELLISRLCGLKNLLSQSEVMKNLRSIKNDLAQGTPSIPYQPKKIEEKPTEIGTPSRSEKPQVAQTETQECTAAFPSSNSEFFVYLKEEINPSKVPSLAGLFDQIIDIEIEKNSAVFVLATPFHAEIINNHKEYIQGVIRSKWGKNLLVKTRISAEKKDVEQSEQESEAVDNVALVASVFKATVIDNE